MRSSSSVVQIHRDHRRHGTAAARRSSSSRQPPPDLAESLAATMASVVSLLEAAIRIQEQAAEVLQDLAALTGNETVIQRLSRMKDPLRRPAALHDSLSAQPGRADSQPRPAVSQRRPSSLAEPLTPRERAVLRLMASRLSRREIGRELYVSLNTVKSHTSAIYRKLGVSNRPEAVQRSRELAIIVGLPFADAAHHQAGHQECCQQP